MPPIGTVPLNACEIVMAGIKRFSTRAKNECRGRPLVVGSIVVASTGLPAAKAEAKVVAVAARTAAAAAVRSARL